MWARLHTTVTPRLRQSPAVRTFLSEAYRSSDAWNQRLTTPILQKVKPEKFYYELESKFQQQGKCSAIDIDIFANRLNDGAFVDEVADLMHKLRMTEETTNTLDSTGHAVIRIYLEHAEAKDLLFILNDRLSYGLFLDTFTANLALDKFIRAKDFSSAARIATMMMLQEDLSNEITRTLSLYACVKYLQNPQPFEAVAVPDEPAAVDPAAAAAPTPAKGKKKKEEIKVRVKFIRNEYFDEHFDLRDESQLVGKTLLAIAKLSADGALANSTRLLGLFHYGKYTEATELVRSLAVGSAVHKDVVDAIVAEVDKTAEPNEELATFLEAIKNLAGSQQLLEDNFEKAVCNVANASVTSSEAKDIEAQQKIYADWCTLRDTKLNDELERMRRAERLSEIERVTRDMDSEEQKLWFFENEEKLDLQIDSKKVHYRKRWFGKLKKPRVIDAGYVPPEIVRKSNK